MLALPEVSIPPDATTYETMPREGILDKGDLKEIKKRWTAIFTRKFQDAGERKSVFLGVYGAGIQPGITQHTLDFADRMIERQTAASYWLLDAVDKNRQLLFCGGPGTGKTWMAIEQARRWAQERQRVLFLTYNLKLAEVLQKAVARLRLPAISVLSYEGLAQWMYHEAGEK